MVTNSLPVAVTAIQMGSRDSMFRVTTSRSPIYSPLESSSRIMTLDPQPYEFTSAAIGASPVSPKSARHQLLPIATTLLLFSILHIVGGLSYFVFVYSRSAAPDADPMQTHVSIVYCMYYGITMMYCLLLMTGAFSMMRRGSYMWAMTTCILAMIPILGPCYIVAIPVGIWGVLVLRRAEVRNSFTSM
jgi:hypothetical protein